MLTEVERFWRKVIKNTGGCWQWIGAKNKWGYGYFGLTGGRLVRAHRWSYVDAKGAIHAELQLDHLCRNRLCVNPDHLEAVTSRVNSIRSDSPSGLNARKVACLKGHLFSPENTYVSKTGRRHCRQCHCAKEQVRRETQRRTACL